MDLSATAAVKQNEKKVRTSIQKSGPKKKKGRTIGGRFKPGSKGKKKTAPSRSATSRQLGSSPVRLDALWAMDFSGFRKAPEEEKDMEVSAIAVDESTIRTIVPVAPAPVPRIWYPNENVELENGVIHCTSSKSGSINYIFGQEMQLRDCIAFRIVGTDDLLPASLTFGLIKQDPAKLDLNTLPVNPQELQTSISPTQSSVVEDLINRPYDLGDVFILNRTVTGIWITGPDMEKEWIISVPMDATACYPFFCFNGRVSAIQLVPASEITTHEQE